MNEYEIMYEYTDETGQECSNVTEFTGTWAEVQEEIKRMRVRGCYNIVAAIVRGSNDNEQTDPMERQKMGFAAERLA